LRLGYTRLQLTLEVLSAFLLLAMLFFLLFSWSSLPDRIPVHFNGAGEIDRWGGKGSIIILPAASVLMYAMLTVISFFPQAWNMPVRMTEQNKWALLGLTKSMLLFMKAEILALFLYLTYSTAKAEPLSPALLPVVLALVFGTIGFFILRMLRLNGRSG